MATIAGNNWYVVKIQRLDPRTGRDVYQVAWHDTYDTSFGPYLRSELEFEREDHADAAMGVIAGGFKFGNLNPSDVDSVVDVGVQAAKSIP